MPSLPLLGKDPECVWLLEDEGGREVVAWCQPGFPDQGYEWAPPPWVGGQCGGRSWLIPGRMEPPFCMPVLPPPPSCLSAYSSPQTLPLGPIGTGEEGGASRAPHSCPGHILLRQGGLDLVQEGLPEGRGIRVPLKDTSAH